MLFNGRRAEAVLYWFKTGDHSTGNYFLNSWYWARQQLTLGTPTSTMIKLTAPVGPQGEEPAFEVLEDFATQLMPVLDEILN